MSQYLLCYLKYRKGTDLNLSLKRQYHRGQI